MLHLNVKFEQFLFEKKFNKECTDKKKNKPKPETEKDSK